MQAEEIGPEHYGRIWRVNRRNGSDISNGHKGVRRLVLSENGVRVKRTDGQESVPMEEIERVLVKDAGYEQRTLAAYMGGAS